MAFLGIATSALLAATVAFPARPSPGALAARFYSADDPAIDFVDSVLKSADLTLGLAGHTDEWRVQINDGLPVPSSRSEFLRLVRGVPERGLAVIALQKNFIDRSEPSSDAVAEVALAEAGFRWIVVYSGAGWGVSIDRVRHGRQADTTALPSR